MHTTSFSYVHRRTARLRLAVAAGLSAAWLAACGTDPGAGETAATPPRSTLVLRPQGEFRDREELASTPVRTASGALLPLREIANLQLEPAEPPLERMWINGRPAVGLGIVIPENRLNAVRFGTQVRKLLDEVRPHYAPLEIHEMFYQPQWVEARLSELARSLLMGVAIVVLVLVSFMGLRLGLTVAGSSGTRFYYNLIKIPSTGRHRRQQCHRADRSYASPRTGRHGHV